MKSERRGVAVAVVSPTERYPPVMGSFQECDGDNSNKENLGKKHNYQNNSNKNQQ